MKAKKFAVRALIVLAVVVAVCMFFSGTIRTIATAKVKITSPRQGKLIQKVELSGKLTFPVSEKVYLTGAGDASVEITSVKVLPGYAVAKGDVLFEAAVADYEKTMTQLRGEYDAIEQQLQALLQKGIKLKRTDQAWAEAYTALIDCRSKATDTKLAADTLLRVEGLLRTQDGTAPDGASEALVQALREQAEADSALSAAQQYMTDADRYAIAEDTRTYIVEKKKLEDQLATAGESMLNLSVLNQKLKSVVAEQDGYVTEVNVKVGETFDPRAAAYAICPAETLPVLRAPIDGTVRLAISKGMDVTFLDKNDREVTSTVAEMGMTLSGEKYADIELTGDIIADMGGVYAMTLAETVVEVEYKARQSTTLIPASAVRGSGQERYVYTLRQEQSAFGTNRLVTVKTDVKVLAEAEGLVSVEEDLSYQQVAYMEDRPIADNTTVMEYTE